MKKEIVKLEIEGMMCDGCVRTVTNSLKDEKGIIRQKVDLEQANAIVDYDADLTNTEEIAGLINSTGIYSVKRILPV